MQPPDDLALARDRLARAEVAYESREGLARLEDALGLLGDVIDGGTPEQRRIAQNVASAYAQRIITRIHQQVESDLGLPEPQLEHLFKVVLAFDEIPSVLTEDARLLKLRLARRLIDRYYEGRPPADKSEALAQLVKLGRGSQHSGRRSGRTR